MVEEILKICIRPSSNMIYMTLSLLVRKTLWLGLANVLYIPWVLRIDSFKQVHE